MQFVNLFSVFDYIILALTLVTPIGIGVYFGITNEKTTEDLLVGGRKLRIFPVASSIMATTVSAITIIGYPAEVYSFGIQIFQIAIISCICIPISVHLFVPYFYNMRLTSTYEYLELRFHSASVRHFGAFTFILQQVILAGIVLYAPSIALEAFLGFSPWVTILGIGIAGTIYTSIGGLKAVVWTDTFQLILMYFGIIAIFIKAVMVAGGVSRVYELASEGGRLNLFDFSVDPFMRHNFLNFVVGFAVTMIFQPGTRQHEVQRFSSLPTVEAAKRSVLLSIPIKFVALGLSLCTGVALYAAHAGCDPILLGEAKKADELIPQFVIKELGFIPGMLGLFTSCMFCAVLSSYSSSLNGIVAVTWKDFLSKLPICQRMNEGTRSRVSILLGVVYGAIIITLAFSAKHMGGVYQASYAVTGPPSGVLSAVFFMGLFLPFVNKQGALGGMILGLGSTMYICFQAFLRKFVNKTLEMSVDNCTVSQMTNETIFSSERLHYSNVSPELEWPDKMYRLSYVLYPVFAAVVTLVSGIIISLVVRAFSKEEIKVDPKYLHTFMQTKSRTRNESCSGATNGALKFEMCESTGHWTKA